MTDRNNKPTALSVASTEQTLQGGVTKSAQTPRRKSALSRKTLALGTIAATGLGVAACDDGSSGSKVFSSINDCTRGGYSQFVCDREYNAALSRHERQAPRFDSREKCESQFGDNRCEQRSGSSTDNRTTGNSSYFTPLLTGFLVAQALQSVRSPHGYYTWRSRYNDYDPSPIYRNRRGERVTTVRSGRGSSARTTTRPVNVNTRTVSRRGFGGRSFRRSWGG